MEKELTKLDVLAQVFKRAKELEEQTAEYKWNCIKSSKPQGILDTTYYCDTCEFSTNSLALAREHKQETGHEVTNNLTGDFVKNAPEEKMDIERLDKLAVDKFLRKFNDLNEAEKDEIMAMINSPLIAQPPIVPKPTIALVQPKGQTIGEQSVLKGITREHKAEKIKKEGELKPAPQTYMEQENTDNDAFVNKEVKKEFSLTDTKVSNPESKLMPMQSNPELANKYNELIDKANNVKAEVKSTQKMMDADLERKDVFV